MLHRPLGATGLQLPMLGFGASPLGGVFAPIDADEATRAVRLALDLGIDFFDVAPYYGATTAESALGRALAGVPRGSYRLATKVGRLGTGEFDVSADGVAASLEASLRRLGTDHVDLLQCHDIEFSRLDRIVDETLPALDALRRAGKCRFIGITGLPLAVFPPVLAKATVAIDAVLSYCHYTLNDTTLAGLLPALAARGVGVLNASPLAMGMLTGNPPPAWHPAPPPLKAACAAASAHCAARGSDLARLALQFAVTEPAIACTLVGMATTAEVRRNVEAIASPPDPTLLAEVRRILAPLRDVTWRSGLPENN